MTRSHASSLAMLLFAMLVGGCSTGPRCRMTYDVRYLPEAKITVDGVMDEPAWGQADAETRFSFPWESRLAPPTEFRAVCDDRNLYFVFRVHDDDVVVEDAFTGEDVVVREDRVELFFTLDPELKTYYCAEIDPRGRVSDYAATFYRRFDRGWRFPGLRTVGAATRDGYIVEGSIPHSTFEVLGLPVLTSASGRKLITGVFRAEFSHGAGADPVQAWISWVHPRTAKPDFHVPGAFGCFRMVR